MLAPPGEDFAQHDNKVNNGIVAVTVNHRAICITEFMTFTVLIGVGTESSSKVKSSCRAVRFKNYAGRSQNGPCVLHYNQILL